MSIFISQPFRLIPNLNPSHRNFLQLVLNLEPSILIPKTPASLIFCQWSHHWNSNNQSPLGLSMSLLVCPKLSINSQPGNDNHNPSSTLPQYSQLQILDLHPNPQPTSNIQPFPTQISLTSLNPEYLCLNPNLILLVSLPQSKPTIQWSLTTKMNWTHIQVAHSKP